MVSPFHFFTIVKPIHGKLISKLLARKAATAPGADAFHIHQVVDTFHMNMVRYVSPENCQRLCTCVSIHCKGIHATKINKVKGETGHAAKSNRPVAKASHRF